MQRLHIDRKIGQKSKKSIASKLLGKNWIHLEVDIVLLDMLSSGPRCDAAVDRAKLLT